MGGVGIADAPVGGADFGCVNAGEGGGDGVDVEVKGVAAWVWWAPVFGGEDGVVGG